MPTSFKSCWKDARRHFRWHTTVLFVHSEISTMAQEPDRTRYTSISTFSQFQWRYFFPILQIYQRAHAFDFELNILFAWNLHSLNIIIVFSFNSSDLNLNIRLSEHLHSPSFISCISSIFYLYYLAFFLHSGY